jgi:hypothetical protein
MYKVRWEATALNELTELWLQASARMRAAITASSTQVDGRLAEDPWGNGESGANGRRILFASPLTVAYRIEEDEETVSVLHVWLFRLQNGPQ